MPRGETLANPGCWSDECDVVDHCRAGWRAFAAGVRSIRLDCNHAELRRIARPVANVLAGRDVTGFHQREMRNVHTCPLPQEPESGEGAHMWQCPRCARRWYWSTREMDGRQFHGWAPMRESLEDWVRRVELEERRRIAAWAVIFTLSACVVLAIAIIVMLAQVS